jgi:hypothetical protein
MEFNIYAAIKPSELLNQAWSKPKLKHRAQNVIGLIDRFNAVSVWVGALIVCGQTLKDRVRAMAKFIRLAKVNNF